jgi:hypothetical protein
MRSALIVCIVFTFRVHLASEPSYTITFIAAIITNTHSPPTRHTTSRTTRHAHTHTRIRSSFIRGLATTIGFDSRLLSSHARGRAESICLERSVHVCSCVHVWSTRIRTSACHCHNNRHNPHHHYNLHRSPLVPNSASPTLILQT